MSNYNFNDIEKKWQEYWAKNKTFKANNNTTEPNYYVLDMFPYPSGAGLHVGHPLGYIASDIYARYKRHKGFNVLHPQGYDSFGLPAEQYAIQTGQHPAKTTEVNISRYRNQLDKIGFSFDWSREVRTSNPDYYKWTQWIFIQLFESWYCKTLEKALPISELINIFEEEGNIGVNAKCDKQQAEFSAKQWNDFDDEKKQRILLNYRLAYLAETEVNWCPKLGTVLANDEIVNGVSERGGYPVVRKKMMQWSMRISNYADRLLTDLENLDWSESLKDTQRNWIGKSVGAAIKFKVFLNKKDAQSNYIGATIGVFSTRPDTIFGASFIALAPEHELVQKITTIEQRFEVAKYIEETAKKSERDRMADVKNTTGVFTGAYAEHPFTKEKLPVWIADYVLATYGTGAVMGVPAGDQRDYDFAKKFHLPIKNIFKDIDVSEKAYEEKGNTIIANSDFISGMPHQKASEKVIEALEKLGQGKKKINYRLRDAVFSRQRYWGEPFPVYYKHGLPQMIDLKHLPLVLPKVEKYLPTETGKPPLGRADNWAWDTRHNIVVNKDLIDDITVFPLELNTMPGWAGSSWYFFRYMDPKNTQEFASKEALEYWKNVDLYIGGSEHATGHLLYSRFWTKFLFDRGFVPVNEPFKKLINQGMILGESAFVYYLELEFSNRVILNFALDKKTYEKLILDELEDFDYEIFKEHPCYDEDINFSNLNRLSVNKDNIKKSKNVPIEFVNNSNELDFEKAFQWEPNLKNIHYPLNSNGKYEVFREVEKMSKSKYNVVNPDDICEQYGADTLRMYEMFLGPLEQAKPWSTAGITGVHNFLKKLWRLYHTGENGAFFVNDNPASKESLKTLHKTIKKVTEDIENFSFNTSVSTFMIAVNELTAQKCNSKEVLEPLAVLIAPYAPHIAEELWQKLGYEQSISTVAFPVFNNQYLVEDSKEYPVSFNGKMRFKIELPLSLTKDEIETAVMAHEKTQHYLQGRTPKKVIVVPGKIVNIVG